MAREILVVAEHRQGRLREVTLEMLAAAANLAEQMAAETVCLLLGRNVESLAVTLAAHAHKVVCADHADFADFNSERYQKVIVDLVKARKPALVLIAHSAQGADLAPAVAVAAHLALLTDAIAIDHDAGELRITRQFFQGKLNADYLASGTAAHLLTVREGAFAIKALVQPGTIEKLTVAECNSDYKKFIEYLEPQVGAVDITKSSILVAVGRGIKEQKNLKIIEDLAAALNADLCGSRVAIDAGWLPQERQVGITGKIVKPKLYIAIGISGSFQHLAGMSGAKTIVAINKDPKAPIFTVADFAIVDDLFKVVPKLTEKVKALRQAAA